MGGSYCTEESGLRLPANQFNPSGFFERRDVVEANDRILSSAGGASDHPECLNFAAVSAEDQQRFSNSVSKIASDLTTLSPSFVKDPRFCLTLNLWLPHFDRPIVVLPYRHPIAVAKSLRSRDGFPLSFGIALWELHMIRALESAHALPTLVIGFENILAQAPGTVTRLDTFFRQHRLEGFSTPSPATLESLVDSALSHHSVDECDPPLDGKVMAIYELLHKAERTGELPPRVPDLSEHSRIELSRFHQFTSAAEERLRKSEERAKGLARMLKQIDVKLDATAASKRFSSRRLKAAIQLFRTGQLREARRWQERYRNELSAVEAPRRSHDDDGAGSQVKTRFRVQHDPVSPFRGRWPDAVCPARPPSHHEARSTHIIGAFAGEGVGTELVSLSLELVAAATQRCGFRVEVRHGGPIGSDAVAAEGKPLTDTAIEFCQDIFAAGGAVLTVPGAVGLSTTCGSALISTARSIRSRLSRSLPARQLCAQRSPLEQTSS